ncbi:MAG: tripartite tricarboxylate transporter substrate-binding protein [Xenophilus sp.]
MAPAGAARAAGGAIPRLRIFIPANEGGGWDQTGRALGAAMVASGAASEVMYENLGGKGGVPGLARYVERYGSEPDAMLVGGMVMVGAVALHKPPVTLARVAPVARLTSDYGVLVVRADSPVMTPKDLMAQLRGQPDKTPIAGGSAGGVDHMFAGMLARVAGRTADLVYQPYPGGAQVVEAVLGGKAVAGISGHSEFSEDLAKGRLRAIGVSSKRPFLGIPSFKEQGVDVDLDNWRGVFTGQDVSADHRRALLDAVRRAVASEVWQKAVKRNNWDPFWQDGADFQNFVQIEASMADVLIYLLKLNKG